MKKIVLFLLMVISPLILSGCGGSFNVEVGNATKVPVKLDLTNTFQEAGFGFTIKYPTGWTYSKKGTGATILFEDPKRAETVNIQKVVGLASKVTTDLKNSMYKGANGVNMTNEKVFTYSKGGKNLVGNEFVVEYTYNGTEFKQWQIVIPSDEKNEISRTWAYTAPKDAYDTYLPVAQDMLNSWEILND